MESWVPPMEEELPSDSPPARGLPSPATAASPLPQNLRIRQAPGPSGCKLSQGRGVWRQIRLPVHQESGTARAHLGNLGAAPGTPSPSP